MEIHIKRAKESSKGLISGKDWKLISNISVSLSDDEQALVKEYYDPSIDFSELTKSKQEIELGIKELDFEQKGKKLSDFNLTIATGKHKNLPIIEHYERAMAEALSSELKHLRIVAAWEGEQTLTPE